MRTTRLQEENVNNINIYEKCLLRKGDIITPIGVFRAAMANNGVLEKDHFDFLVRVNYFLEEEQDLPQVISSKIVQVWYDSRKFFEELDIIEEYNDNKIVIRHPEGCFLI